MKLTGLAATLLTWFQTLSTADFMPSNVEETDDDIDENTPVTEL